MTSLISLRLDDELLKELKAKAEMLQVSQTDYIRRAIVMLNDETEKRARAERLKKASFKVRAESMKINEEFGKIEHDPEN